MNVPSPIPALAVDLSAGHGSSEATKEMPMLELANKHQTEMGPLIGNPTRFTSLHVQSLNDDSNVEDTTITDSMAERRSRDSSASTDESIFGGEGRKLDMESATIHKEPVSGPLASQNTVTYQAATHNQRKSLGPPMVDQPRHYSFNPHNTESSLTPITHGREHKEAVQQHTEEVIEEELEEKIEYPKIGVIWEKNGFQVMPKWSWEPRIKSIIAVLEKEISPLKNYKVKHMWNGTYNKLYSVDFDGKQFVMKLTLPVCPKTKTESEVATLRWTNNNTNLAVPKVKWYSSDANNAIGCEWILMTRIEGTPLSDRWREVTIGSKMRIVVQLAEYATAVYNKQFRGIGNIYPGNDGSGTPRLGELASMPFFWNTRPAIDPYRGPFKTNKEWEQQRLLLSFAELWDRLRDVDVWPRRHLAWRMLGMCGRGLRLWNLSNDIFTRELEQPAASVESLRGEAEEQELRNQSRAHTAATESEPEPNPSRENETKRKESYKNRPSYGFIFDSDDEEEVNQEPGTAALMSLASEVHPLEEEPNRDSDASLVIDELVEDGQMSDWEHEVNEELQQERLPVCPEKDAFRKAFENCEKFRDGEKHPCGLEQQLPDDFHGALPFHPRDQMTTTANSGSNGISNHVYCRGGDGDEGYESMSEKEEKKRVHIDDEKELATERNSESGSEAEPESEPEPTMLWHDNISADNIMVDENGILTGVLDWDCVSCLPVASSCDWPAFLQDGRHRAEEPDVRDYLDLERGRLRLRENYWRARADFERTHLRLAFAAEMRWRCPGWYATWAGGQMRRDYEAAVQNCDNEFAIGLVEGWCDAVEGAIADGRALRAPEVMGLAGKLTEGVDWTLWDD